MWVMCGTTGAEGGPGGTSTERREHLGAWASEGAQGDRAVQSGRRRVLGNASGRPARRFFNKKRLLPFTEHVPGGEVRSASYAPFWALSERAR